MSALHCLWAARRASLQESPGCQRDQAQLTASSIQSCLLEPPLRRRSRTRVARHHTRVMNAQAKRQRFRLRDRPSGRETSPLQARRRGLPQTGRFPLPPRSHSHFRAGVGWSGNPRGCWASAVQLSSLGATTMRLPPSKRRRTNRGAPKRDSDARKRSATSGWNAKV